MTDNKTEKTKTENKRAAPISYRPPAALRAAFHERVESSGLSANAFITKAVFEGRLRPEQALLARLLAEAASIRDALHDIALTGADTPANALHLEMALRDLTEIRAALVKAYGRRP